MTDFAGSDFLSEFWHYYIAALTVFGIVFSLWLLKSQTTKKLAAGEEAEVMAPTWDGDLQELNNPLPRWWMWMFYGLIFFGIGYLVLYPGFGKFAGTLGWSSFQEWKDDKDAVDAEFEKVMAPFRSQDLMTVAADPKAKEMGQNLFMTYCSQCHGSSGQGGKGFPNLTDAQWLFGGAPDDVKASIANGRLGEMPGGLAGDEQGAKEVANYVLALGGKPHDAALAAAGKDKYAACAGCHGEDGKGNNAASFPNLTDDAWQYGGSEAAIIESIVKGRKGGMPAQLEALGESKVHLLSAYVWGLGGGAKSVVASSTATPVAGAPEPSRIFFEVGKAAVPADLAATLQPIVDYAAANAGAKVAISGYHDPSGNQAANEELAKNRAKAIREALKAAGIAEDRIEMRKPASTEGGGSAEEARRVEVSII